VKYNSPDFKRSQLENMSEHKIQAIYESLDSGNHKLALKQCEKMLGKSKISPLIMVPSPAPLDELVDVSLGR